MKTSSKKKPSPKATRKAPVKKAAASTPRKKTAPAKKKAATTRRKATKATSSVLTAFEHSVKQGVEALRKTGREIRKAVTPDKTRKKKARPPILLGSMGIDLPPIKAPKPKTRRKKA